jgi:hypothetical protein
MHNQAIKSDARTSRGLWQRYLSVVKNGQTYHLNFYFGLSYVMFS